MDARVQTIKEYSFADLGKVLLAGLKRAIICAIILTVLLGGALSCLAIFVTHDEYTATIVKIDDSYDVPIIRATFRGELQSILPEVFADKALTEDQINVLSREFDNHIAIEEKISANSVYNFTLTSFNSSVIPLSKKDFTAVMNTIMASYQNKYAEKIVSTYTIESDSLSIDFLSTLKSNNYYLQTQLLSSYLDSIINEIKTITSINSYTIIDQAESLIVPLPRSEFSAYRCPENNRRVSDALLALDSIHYEISYAQSYISRNGVEKTDAKPMSEYIQGQLINDPNNYLWTALEGKFNENSPYQQASESEKLQLVTETERLLEDVILQLQTVLEDYNLIARGFANSIVSDYVIISSLIENKSVGALDAFTVIVITLAGVVIGIILCYVLQFYKMQKEGSIGVEVTEEKDEE